MEASENFLSFFGSNDTILTNFYFQVWLLLMCVAKSLFCLCNVGVIPLFFGSFHIGLIVDQKLNLSFNYNLFYDEVQNIFLKISK